MPCQRHGAEMCWDCGFCEVCPPGKECQARAPMLVPQVVQKVPDKNDDERGIRLHGPLYKRRRCTNCKMVYPFGLMGTWRQVDGDVQHCGCSEIAQAGHFPSEPVPPEDPWSDPVSQVEPPVEVNEDG